MTIKRWAALALLSLPIAVGAEKPAQNSQFELARQMKALAWVHGPSTVSVGDEATINLPKGAMYLDSTQTKRFLELNGNPPTGTAYTIAPETLSWFAIYGFSAAGYVNDNETINPPQLLNSLLKSQNESNDERKTLNMSPLYVDGWAVQPHYDRASHNLEWATQMHDDHGSKLVNYTSRILGRSGVMSATLVSDPTNLATDLPNYRSIVAGFAYLPEKRYEAHKDGDKLAAYGLGALITGGAAAVAVKTGLFAGIFAVIAKFALAFSKFIALGAIAVFAGIANWFKKIFNRRADAE